MRFFNFEMHLSPILDMAVLSYNNKFSFEISGGLEAVVFPAFMRSLYVRVSLGYNLRELFAWPGFASGHFFDYLFSAKNPELFFGIGHHY
jgi:hypothetical protein